MKLTELNPEWVYHEGSKAGMTFLCPHCKEITVIVYFKNPIGDGGPANVKNLWVRVGETFDTLTLTPSINASKPPQPIETITVHVEKHWHGFITNGEVISCSET